MNNASIQPRRSTPISPAHRRRDWGRALIALARLARNTEDTTQVFEILRALNGDCLERTHRRMLKSESGRRILRDKPKLAPQLGDHAYLTSLPSNSLGSAYLRFMIAGGITPEGLFDAMEQASENDTFNEETDPELQYVGERLIEMHDLWHVLTGYGRDDTGELSNLWFSYGQFGQLGMAFIALMGSLDGPPGRGFFRYQRTAYLRGRRAELLVAQPLEQMLELPLSQAREALKISPPDRAHPRGILTGNRHREGIGRGLPVMTAA